MKSARIIVFGVAAAAGGLAWLMASNIAPQAPEAAPEVAQATETTRVLVARYDLSIGERLSEAAVEWRDWPVANVAAAFISEDTNPNAMRDLDQGIVTAPI